MLLAAGIVQISWFHASLLGLLQGLTEFLPVSSTAHMDVIPQLFHQPDPGAAFSAVVQLGPIVAIIAYFRADLSRYIRGIVRTRTPAGILPGDTDARLGWYTILATIPLIIFGVLLEHRIDHQFRKIPIVAASLILLGAILFLAERYGARRTLLERMTFKQSQVIGWAQVLALVPGASRSGVTITAGLFQGLDRESAARFSFLLSIPAITAAGIYKLIKVLAAAGKAHEVSLLAAEVGPYLLASVVAGLLAYVVIRWFLGYMREHSTMGFIIYRILLGIALLLLYHAGALRNRPTNGAAPPAAQAQSAAVPTTSRA